MIGMPIWLVDRRSGLFGSPLPPSAQHHSFSTGGSNWYEHWAAEDSLGEAVNSVSTGVRPPARAAMRQRQRHVGNGLGQILCWPCRLLAPELPAGLLLLQTDGGFLTRDSCTSAFQYPASPPCVHVTYKPQLLRTWLPADRCSLPD